MRNSGNRIVEIFRPGNLWVALVVILSVALCVPGLTGCGAASAPGKATSTHAAATQQAPTGQATVPSPSPRQEGPTAAATATEGAPNVPTQAAIEKFEFGVYASRNGDKSTCQTDMQQYSGLVTHQTAMQQWYLARYNYPTNLKANLITTAYLNWVCDTAYKSATDVNVTDTDNKLTQLTAGARAFLTAAAQSSQVGDTRACMKNMAGYLPAFQKLTPAAKIYLGDQSLPVTPDALTASSIVALCTSLGNGTGAPA